MKPLKDYVAARRTGQPGDAKALMDYLRNLLRANTRAARMTPDQIEEALADAALAVNEMAETSATPEHIRAELIRTFRTHEPEPDQLTPETEARLTDEEVEEPAADVPTALSEAEAEREQKERRQLDAVLTEPVAAWTERNPLAPAAVLAAVVRVAMDEGADADAALDAIFVALAGREVKIPSLEDQTEALFQALTALTRSGPVDEDRRPVAYTLDDVAGIAGDDDGSDKAHRRRERWSQEERKGSALRRAEYHDLLRDMVRAALRSPRMNAIRTRAEHVRLAARRG